MYFQIKGYIILDTGGTLLLYYVHRVNNKEVNMISIQNSNKDILAKLMATENITVIHKSVPTAYFDVKSRTLCCPILKDNMSSELYDLFMGHEVSHALNTPADGWHDKVSDKGMMYKGYLNVIEDVRIEKMIKAKYPGLRKSFYTGYSELASMDFFGTKGKELQDFNLIDRINLSYKIGSFAQIKFSEEEMVYINKCELLETFEDVLELADELFEKQQQETKDDVASMTQPELQDLLDDLDLEDDEDEQEDTGETESLPVKLDDSEEENDEDEQGEGSDANAEDDQNTDSSEENSNNSTETKKSDEEETEKSKGNEAGKKGSNGQSAIDKLNDELNKSATDESFRSNEDTLHGGKDHYYRDPSYNELNTRIQYENFIVTPEEIQSQFDNVLEPYNDTIKKTVKTFTEDNKKIIAYMVKEFEMKKAAASYNRSWNSKSGELDMNKLAFYKLKDDIFNRVQVTPEGKNHGVVMAVDWSGSMSGSVRATIEQATLLSMFCRRLAIPFRLFAFSDSYLRPTDADLGMTTSEGNTSEEYDVYSNALHDARAKYYSDRTFGKNYNSDDNQGNKWDLGNLSLLEVYNEKMSNRQFTKAMENWFQLASSVDNRYNSWDHSENDFDSTWFHPPRLHLSGTPLDHTLIAMRDYLVDFKRECGLDITSLIVLSDGASHGCFNRSNPYLLDRKINKTFKLNVNRGSTTHGLLEWVAETADCRTIGFYICESAANQMTWDAECFCNTTTDSYGPEMAAKKKEYNKLSTSFTDGCYDLAILINQKKLKLDVSKDIIDVQVGANKGVLKRALVKAGSNKMQQRVILNQFVGQMAV